MIRSSWRALHKQLGTLDGPVPIADIAVALGIGDVRTVPLDGCEGILLTDRPRSRGTILVNNGRGPQAARFGIGHELGHFLLERHELGLDGKFVCNLDDLRQSRTARQYKKQEVEANEFAIAVLAPHYRTAPFLGQQPEIAAVQAMAKALDLSLEATHGVSSTNMTSHWPRSGRPTATFATWYGVQTFLG